MTRFQFPVRTLPIPMQEFANELEHAVDHFFKRPSACSNGDANGGVSVDYIPAMDVHENDNSYMLELDLPGIRPGDMKLEVHEDRLSVVGTRAAAKRDENSESNWATKISERTFGNYRRTLALPKNADVENISATLQDGVLLVTIPKTLNALPRQIEVKHIASTTE
jgi:HSP20 family protein